MNKRKSVNRDLITASAIGIAGSIIVVPLTYVQVAAGIAHVYLVSLTLGLWMLPCILPLIVLRRPGSSLIACLAMGFISAVTTPFGPSAIVALLFEGFLVEFPFMVTLYRKWHGAQFVTSIVLLSVMMGAMTPLSVGVEDPSVTMMLLSTLITLISGLVFLWVGFRISDRLRRAGVMA